VCAAQLRRSPLLPNHKVSLLSVRRYFTALPLALLLALIVGVQGGLGQEGQPERKSFDGPPFSWPTAGRLTQDYGCTEMSTNPRRGSCRGFHNGIDIANAWGTQIVAAAPGLVKHVGWDPYDRSANPAWVVIIEHDNGLRTWYAHLLPRRLDGARVGDVVEAGQLIGLMGMTGYATGVHLHLMVERGGEFLDPNRYFDGPPPRVWLEHWQLVPLIRPSLGKTVL
jgi:murein DD-endopeptidase MepM/ murein hydrolase activator NlpD